MDLAKILVMEKKTSIARDIRGNLKRLGHEVTAILQTEDECIREIFKNKPDIILIDIDLNEGKFGLEIAENFKKNFSIPVIYIISEFDMSYLLRLKKVEPYEFVLKPVNEKNLYSSVEISLYRDKMDKKLQESEWIYRTIFENTGNATIFIEEDTTISLANREFEKLSAYNRDDIEGKKSWTEFISRDDLDRMKDYHRLRRIDPSAAPRNYEFQFVDRYGDIKDIFMTADIIPGTKKSVASFMNISEQKRLESEILRISEQERHQIGIDLHDGLGPHLVGIKFLANLLKQKLEQKNMEEAKNADEISGLITDAIDHTRQMVKGLSPVDIDADGISFAIADLTRNVEKVYGIKCSFTQGGTLNIKNKFVAIHLFLITQEAVNNAVKHSNAKNIGAELIENDGAITLTVKDDGTGIENILDRREGMGINIMKYRARIIDASLYIGPNDTGGTRVTCTYRKE